MDSAWIEIPEDHVSAIAATSANRRPAFVTIATAPPLSHLNLRPQTYARSLRAANVRTSSNLCLQNVLGWLMTVVILIGGLWSFGNR